MTTTYSLSIPPNTPGIYLLKHRTTGEVYVGAATNLTTRYFNWRGKMKSSTGWGPFPASDLEEWDFIVLQLCPGANTKSLRQLETKVINRIFEQAPELLLNTVDNVRKLRASKFVVYDENDQPVAYRDACRLLDVGYNTFHARLMGLRRKGKTRITVDDLRRRGIFAKPQ